MDRRSWLDPLALVLLVFGAAGRVAAAPGSPVPPSAPLASENWEARTQLQETIFAPVLDAAGTWQLRAEVRGPQGTPVDFAFTVTLHG